MTPFQKEIYKAIQRKLKETTPQITAGEFAVMIHENPSVFEHWDTPLEILGYVNARDSQITHITHLSPHLTFAGTNNEDFAASFRECPNLKIATGTFHGSVDFGFSNIEKIENLTVTQPDKNGWAASFWGCKKLKSITGTYPGFLFLTGSGIESLKSLHIEKHNISGKYLDVSDCPNLKNLSGWDLSKQITIESEKLEAEPKRRAIQKFLNKTQPEELPFL
jgi:hypothetical protein